MKKLKIADCPAGTTFRADGHKRIIRKDGFAYTMGGTRTILKSLYLAPGEVTDIRLPRPKKPAKPKPHRGDRVEVRKLKSGYWRWWWKTRTGIVIVQSPVYAMLRFIRKDAKRIAKRIRNCKLVDLTKGK